MILFKIQLVYTFNFKKCFFFFLRKIIIDDKKINLNLLTVLLYEKSFSLIIYYIKMHKYFYFFRYFKFFFENVYLFDDFSVYIKYNHISFNLARRQIFFNLLDFQYRSTKSFSCGYVFRFFKKQRKSNKYNKKYHLTLVFFLKQYFKYFLKKNMILIFNSYRLKHKDFILKASNEIGFEKAHYFLNFKTKNVKYFFRRVKAVKRRIRRLLK